VGLVPTCFYGRIAGKELIVLLYHVLLEIFCLKNTDQNQDKDLPEFCPEVCVPGYHCLQHQCPFLAFTSCENTLCYINEKAEMEAGVLFGGDMESEGDNTQNLNLWKSISVDAINVAYEEYMRQKQDK
jgi:hypothetical protein